MDEDTHTDTPQKLSDSDQAKVDAFLARGVNSVDRKPFRPLFLIFLLMAVVAGFSLLSQGDCSVGWNLLIWTGIALALISPFGILRASVCSAAW